MKIKVLRMRKADRELATTNKVRYDQSGTLKQIEKIKALMAGQLPLARSIRLFDFFDPHDEQRDVKERLATTSYKPYMPLIVNYFSSFLFDHPIFVTTKDGANKPSWEAEFVLSTDGNNKSFSDLVQNCFDRATVTQQVAVLLSKPRIDDASASLTQSDVETLGLDQVHIEIFDGSEICDYLTDKNGELTQIILDKYTAVRPSLLSEEIQHQHDWLVVDRETVSHYRYASEKRLTAHVPDDLEATLIEQYRHGLNNKVPVVLLSFDDSRWLCGQLFNPVCENILARTARGYFLNTVSYPQTIIFSELSPAAIAEATKALGPHKIKLNQNDKVERTIPPAEAYQSLQDWVRETLNQIFLVCGQTSFTDQEKNSSWRSAAAKNLDTEQGHKLASDLGSIVRTFATQLINVVSLLKGDAPNFLVNGFDHVKDLNAVALVDLVSKLAETDFANLDNIDPGFSKLVKARLTKLTFADEPEEKLNKIQRSIEATKSTDTLTSPSTTASTNPNSQEQQWKTKTTRTTQPATA